MIFLTISIPFGVYSLLIYNLTRRAPGKITLPALYLPLTGFKVSYGLLPVVGYLTIFAVFATPAAASTIILAPLIDRLGAGEGFQVRKLRNGGGA
ncbi:hypothetical protein AFULGI_00018300 [Archaeoglobus fulgidus DSM 8774]|uniref:Uncharacterized protein n=1 Tax=Archaeoglobus fulgidus DSM 8774 TaxID=1344584 RepID=A0A075WDW8_ARCFL|nr:hypothetical protein [Archaeoglobus fulgidus]AIG98585.1 hypothetical protein AFULGI_00018300 [Archaeoglobus fulgidus DSM 8774]